MTEDDLNQLVEGLQCLTCGHQAAHHLPSLANDPQTRCIGDLNCTCDCPGWNKPRSIEERIQP